MLMSFSVPVFAGMLFLDLMTKSGTFRFFALATLTLVLPVSGASAGSLGDNGAHAAPFGYPSTALNAPATLAEPPAAYVQIGRERLQLGEAELETAALRWGAARLREGTGLFERDYACFEGTESGKPILLWLISSDLKTVTEAQIERVTSERIPAHCGKLVGTDLPVRLGRVGLDMTPKQSAEAVGIPSYNDGFGWQFWFSQRFLKNARGLQELELDWLGVEFQNGRAVRGFASLVKNPS